MSQQIITDFFDRAKMRSLDQDATEAVLEALIYAMAIDGEIHQEEVSILNAAANLLTWRAETSCEDFINQILRASGGRTRILEQLAAHCSRISARIDDPWVAEEVLYLVYRLVRSDGSIDAAETAYSKTLATTLMLTPEQITSAQERAAAESND